MKVSARDKRRGQEIDLEEAANVIPARRKSESSPARSPGQGQSPAGGERSESLDAGEHRDRIFSAGRVH